MHCECANVYFAFLNHLIRKSFKRLPTTLGWARFRKYARRMRELGEHGTLETLSLEVFSVLRLCTINKPPLPNLRALILWGVTMEFVPFIPLFLSPRTTIISVDFATPDLPKTMVASVVTASPKLCPN